MNRRSDAGVARVVFFGFFVGLMSLCWSVHAIGRAESSDSEQSIDVIGNASFLGAYLRFPDLKYLFPRRGEGLLTSTLRLIAQGQLAKHLKFEVNLFTGMSRVPAGQFGGALDSALTMESPYRYRYLTWRYVDETDFSGQMGVDRLNVRYVGDKIGLQVGRMSINYSVTNLFTPNDFFAPFSPTAVSTVYKAGVDGAVLSIASRSMSSIDLVGALGYSGDDHPAWGKSALLLRGSSVLWGFEWSLLGGKLAERWIAGASIQGEVGNLGIRAEGHMGFPDADGDGLLEDRNMDYAKNDVYVRASAGFDMNFEWHNAAIGGEYMFVSDGRVDAYGYLARAATLYPDDFYFLAKHYVGLSASCEIIPILRSGVMGMMNSMDGSGLASLILTYNLSDESDFVAGAMLPWGVKPKNDPNAAALESEFGDMPMMFFLETRFYF